MTNITRILEAYTLITRSILSCRDIEQLDKCDSMITSMSQFNDRSDFHEWVKKIDETYLKHRKNLTDKKMTCQTISSMKVANDLGFMGDGYNEPQPADII